MCWRRLAPRRMCRSDQGDEAVGEYDLHSVGNYQRYHFRLPDSYEGQALHVTVDYPPIKAVTIIDSRTGDFQQLTPDPWARILSSDIKLYENGSGFPRAFFTTEAQYVRDDDFGTEDALGLMRDPAFDPALRVVISGEDSDRRGGFETRRNTTNATITDYTDTRVTMTVDAPDPGYLVLTDAYYPGWVAAVNGVPTPVERADVMFRAVRVPAGQSEVVFEYRPAWLPSALILGGAAWLVALMALVLFKVRDRSST